MYVIVYVNIKLCMYVFVQHIIMYVLCMYVFCSMCVFNSCGVVNDLVSIYLVVYCLN